MGLELYSKSEIPSSDKFNLMVNQVNENTSGITGLSKMNPYESIKKLRDYFYEVTYNTSGIDIDRVNTYFKTSPSEIELGGCSGVFKDGKVLRNLDWNYDNECDFIIHRVIEPVNSDEVKFASVGVASCIKTLTKDVVESNMYSGGFWMLPWMTSEGVNEKGIYAEINVVPKLGTAISINPDKENECCIFMLVRYILDNLDSLDNLSSLLDEVHLFGSDRVTMDCHIFVADSTRSKVIEFNADSYDIIDAPILTNFRTNGGFTFDGTTLLPDWSTIETYGNGVERWEVAANGLTNGDSLDTIQNKLLYTNTYKEETSPLWLTELCSHDNGLTVLDAKNNPEKFDSEMADARVKFAERDRNNPQTWQTCHSSIYDIANKTFKVIVQEKTNETWTRTLSV